MKSHLPSLAIGPRRRHFSRSAPLAAASLGLIPLLVTTQAVAQNRILGDSTSQVTGSQRVALAPSQPVLPEISAPAPALQKASLENPQRIPFLSLAVAQDSGQSSSQNAPVPAKLSKATPAKTKPQHHALGVTLAIVGTAALVAGVVLYAGEQSISVCNGSSSGCNAAKDTGIALMPIGAGVAVTGLYLQFHH